jgi:hypothetical protein
MRLFRSANLRALCGAAAFAAAAVLFGGACAAQPGGDGLTQPAAYHGPYLTWAGKTSSPAVQPDAAPPVAAAARSEFAAWPAPAPGAPRLRPSAATAAYVTPAHAYAPKPAAMATYAPPRHAYAPVAAQKPAAMAAYVAPPAPTLRARRAAQLAVSVPPAAGPQPPAQALAQNDTAAAAPAGNPLGQTGVHYYSLHREYGLTPDQVATPRDRPMVLIGPPDDAPTQKPDDATDGADKHGAAQGADD